MIEFRHAGFDTNFQWIDLRPLPTNIGRIFLAVTGCLLILFGLKIKLPPLLKTVQMLSTVSLLSAGLANAIQFGRMRRAGLLVAENDLSFAWHLILSLAIVIAAMNLQSSDMMRRARDIFLFYLGIAVNVVAVPTVLFFCHGKADYATTPNSVVIAFDWLENAGDANEEPSEQVLATAVSKLNPESGRLILSGDVMNADFTESVTQITKLPAARVAIDSSTKNLHYAVFRSANLCRQIKLDQIAVVADFQHLTRLKRLYREAGLDVMTVPGRTPDTSTQTPANLRPVIVAEIIEYWQSMIDALSEAGEVSPALPLDQ